MNEKTLAFREKILTLASRPSATLNGIEGVGLVMTELRGVLGITQAELGRRLGISAGAVAAIEHSRRQPSFVLINRLHKLLLRGGGE